MWRQLLYALSLVTQLGLVIAFSAVIGWQGGSWVDARLGFTSLGSIIGLLLGLLSGFVVAYRLLVKAFADGGFGDG